MDKLRLVVSKSAENDLEEIWLYLVEFGETVATKQIDDIFVQCERLLVMPEMGRKREDLAPGVRSIVIGRYIVFYRLSEDRVELVRILHTSRDIRRFFR